MDWLIFGSINIIIIVVMFLFLSRRLHRQYNSESFLAEVQQEVNTIITELNQTTERNLQLIEDRMETLSSLTAQLDRRILMVKNDEERRADSTGTYNQLQEQRRLIQREMARPQPVQTPPPAPVEAVAPAAFEVKPKTETIAVRKLPSRDLLKAQVVDMSRAGIASGLIAQHFGISLGEVELIISLQAERQP